jgi:hypothetical protein
LPADSSGLFFGGDCEFLGFPYGGGWRATFDNKQWYWLPFVKHCGVSAMSTVEPKVWVLDGINNEGFSGGPVIFRTGPEQKVFAVISGYVLEPTAVVPSAAKKVPVKKTAEEQNGGARLKVNVNSGFIIAYDIAYAIDAIKKKPIGPVRAPQ